MKRIAIFASGNGSNAENIISYFQDNSSVEICLIVCNKSNAFVLQRANKLNISTLTITRNSFKNTKDLASILLSLKIDLVVLAGFLWLIPTYLIQAFPNKIINIHPALLPKYGGKGMYGQHIHKAVKANNETETGITIHFVNEEYDEGKIIKQISCSLSEDDTIEDIATKIHNLEFEYFPKVIESIILL